MQRMQGLAAELIEQRQKFAEQNFTERGLIRQPAEKTLHCTHAARTQSLHAHACEAAHTESTQDRGTEGA